MKSDSVDIDMPVNSPSRKESTGYAYPSNSRFLRLFIGSTWAILFLCIIFQIIFFWSTNNAFAIICVMLVWSLTTFIFFRGNRLKAFPISSFLVISFALTQFYFPLLFTSIENKPVIFNLELAQQVFIHSLGIFLVLLISHYAYSKIPVKRNHTSFLYRLSFFTSPSYIQIWLMGLIGIGISYYLYFINPSIVRESVGSPINKFLQSLIPFSYAPFFIPLAKLYGKEKILSRKGWIALGFYTILLFAISIGRNSRGAFMIGFTSVGFGYLLGLMLGFFTTKIFTLRNALIALVSLWVITGPMADLGTAMVIVRDGRTDVNADQLVKLTLIAFQDKKSIELRRKDDMESETDWDERYLNNVFTARFSNLKFADASLVMASRTGEKNPAMIDFSIKNVLAALPDPVVKALHFDVDKNDVLGLSFGDFIYILAGGPEYARGNFKTGHMSGTGMAAFGWWYLALLGVGMVPVFWLLDKLVFVQHNMQKKAYRIRFSFCSLLGLITVFQFLPSESVVSIAAFLMRGWPQIVFLYFILFHFTRIIVIFLNKLGITANTNSKAFL